MVKETEPTGFKLDSNSGRCIYVHVHAFSRCFFGLSGGVEASNQSWSGNQEIWEESRWARAVLGQCGLTLLWDAELTEPSAHSLIIMQTHEKICS